MFRQLSQPILEALGTIVRFHLAGGFLELVQLGLLLSYHNILLSRLHDVILQMNGPF